MHRRCCSLEEYSNRLVKNLKRAIARNWAPSLVSYICRGLLARAADYDFSHNTLYRREITCYSPCGRYSWTNNRSHPARAYCCCAVRLNVAVVVVQASVLADPAGND